MLFHKGTLKQLRDSGPAIDLKGRVSEENLFESKGSERGHRGAQLGINEHLASAGETNNGDSMAQRARGAPDGKPRGGFMVPRPLCPRNTVDCVLGAFQLHAGSLHPSVTCVYRPPVCSHPSEKIIITELDRLI